MSIASAGQSIAVCRTDLRSASGMIGWVTDAYLDPIENTSG